MLTECAIAARSNCQFLMYCREVDGCVRVSLSFLELRQLRKSKSDRSSNGEIRGELSGITAGRVVPGR